jgi:hypothetical protein
LKKILVLEVLMNQPRWLETKTQDQPGLQPWVLPDTNIIWETNTDRLAALAAGFAPITLDEMESVALLSRTDTKFIMSTSQLLMAIRQLQNQYKILTVCGKRLNHYRSLYFDTPDFQLYNLHVNDRANRYKVRSREYTDTHLSFLEVKHKTNRDRTIKERIPTPRPVIRFDKEAENWLSGVLPYDSRNLEAKIWNTFSRITLVSIKNCERVTLDVDMTFYAEDKIIQLNDIAIAEVKVDALHRGSEFLTQMHSLRIQSHGFSKYCIGVSMLYDRVKKNAMKPKMLLLNKITEGISNHD